MSARQPTAGSPSTATPREEARKHLLDRLSDHLALHGDSLAELGRRHTPRISRLGWSSQARRVSCALSGEAAQTYRVEMDLPFAVGDPVRIACSCPVSGHGRDRCEHTWAALSRLLGVLGQPGDDPLLEEVFRLDPQPAWSRTLDALDHFLDEHGLGEGRRGGQGPAERSGGVAGPEHRLGWRVRVSPEGVELGVWEQRLSASRGAWTAGRRVGWQRLRESPELWACEADRRAAAAVREPPEGAPEDLDVFRALLSLTGHPLVFLHDEPERRLAVEKVEPRLMASLDGADLVLDAALGGYPLWSFPAGQLHEAEDERGLIGFLEGKQTDLLLLAPAHPHVLRFLRAFNGKPRVVPPAGQAELLRRLTHLETVLPVELPPALAGERVAADERLHLHLAPSQPSGVVAQLRVRPAPEGTACRPGEGPPRLSGVDAGRRVFVERRLDGERHAALRIAARLGLDAQGEERPWQWRLSGDDEALDLIATAQRIGEAELVVEWPAGGRREVAAKLSPAVLRVELEDKNDWLSLRGCVEVGGWQLSLLELLKALRRGRRYVRLAEGQWAEIGDGFRRRLEALDDVLHEKRGRLEADATAVPILRELAAEAELAASPGFLRLVERLDRAEQSSVEPPPELTARLRDYQLAGYRWMRRLAAWGAGGCLADDMGLGKTVQTLAMLLARRGEGPSLVVAPTSLGFNWRREAQRFTPTLRCVLYRDADREALLAGLGDGDVVVVSYGLLARDVEALAAVSWGTLVLDEAQAVKNSRTRTARAVRRIKAGWRLGLTGTPIENHLGELWSLFRTLSPGLFGGWQRFRERFAIPIEKEQDAERRRALSRRVRPFILRRTKSEVLAELPERTEVELPVELSPAERRRYQDARLQALMRLADGEDEGRFRVLAALTRLRQLACHPALVDRRWKRGSAKLDLLLELVDELRQGGHRALVFSQFTRHLGLIRCALAQRGVGVQYLDGQTSVAERARRVDAFQAGEDDVFLISLKAGGTGLNLTAADYVIHMDPWWNPAVEDQATDRAHRMGQTRPVTVYRLVSRGTIEEEILRLHSDKRDLVSGVLAGTDRAAQLSTAELVALLRG